jgi:hypothetical protein
VSSSPAQSRFIASASLTPKVPTRRLGSGDVVRLRQSVTQLYALSEQHGEGAVQGPTGRIFYRLRSLVEHASYDPTTGQALRELMAQAARRMGTLEFHAVDTKTRAVGGLRPGIGLGSPSPISSVPARWRRWRRQASDQHRPREVIDLATAAQRML